MAKRENIDGSSGEPAASPDGAPEQAQAKSELPTVESPSISPATIEPIAAAAPASEPVAAATPAPATRPRFTLNARHKRNALLAASLAIAAALGVVVGALASGGFAAPARTDIAALQERKAVQQSIAHLSKEVTTLKASIEAATKSAHTQTAKTAERFDHAASADITGSISAPQTTAPLPTPRPAPAIPSAANTQPVRLPVLKGWTIHDARGGYVYVEGNGGELFQVIPGAPLPGLGAVETVKRQDGRWMVVTPKGIIVSMRDRRYFESY